MERTIDHIKVRLYIFFGFYDVDKMSLHWYHYGICIELYTKMECKKVIYTHATLTRFICHYIYTVIGIQSLLNMYKIHALWWPVHSHSCATVCVEDLEIETSNFNNV